MSDVNEHSFADDTVELSPESLAASDVRGMKLNRLNVRKVLRLILVEFLGKKVALSLENRHATQNKESIRGIVLSTRFVEIEQIHGSPSVVE